MTPGIALEQFLLVTVLVFCKGAEKSRLHGSLAERVVSARSKDSLLAG